MKLASHVSLALSLRICAVVPSLSHASSLHAASFHSINHYGVIYWGNSSYAINVFHLQKRVVGVIFGIGNRNSSKQMFTTLKILTLSSLYIYSLLCFVVDNMDQYYFVSDIHNRNIRQVFNLNLYQPPTHLSLYQRDSVLP
jgi:hypothetical protein